VTCLDHKNLLALNQKLAAEGLPLERTAFLGRHDFDLQSVTATHDQGAT
jgi:hypothetical protein